MIDTNIRISALLTEGFTRDCLLWIASSDHLILSSEGLHTEFLQVARRKNLLATAEAASFLRALQRQEHRVIPDPSFSPTCRDPDDDELLACAVAGQADAIVSGDRDLLSLSPFQGISILTPRQLLTLLQAPVNPVP